MFRKRPERRWTSYRPKNCRSATWPRNLVPLTQTSASFASRNTEYISCALVAEFSFVTSTGNGGPMSRQINSSVTPELLRVSE